MPYPPSELSPASAMTLQLSIDGRSISARPGQSILDAARAAGIEIPTLCHHPDLSVIGTCRLCVVEIDRYARQMTRVVAQSDGPARQMTACSTPVADGMVVRTESPQLAQSRRFVLEMLLARFHDGDRQTEGAAETEFERWVRHYGAQRPYDIVAPRYQSDSDANPFIRVDWNKCIHCTRCIRACDEIQGRHVWHLADRGAHLEVVAGTGTPMLDARCESCGACAAYCPTGALADRMSYADGPHDRLVTTTCGYCGVGCQFDLNVKDERVVRVTSNPAAPVNGMSLCVKGRYGYDFLHHRERLTQPQVRSYLLEGRAKPAALETEPWVAVDWPTALDLVARRFAAVRSESGGDALAVLSSAKCTNEENYLLQKFARGVLRTHNVDHCARLCHSSTVAGLAMCYGSGAMSNSMDDVAEQAAAMLIIGSNTTEQHPVFGAMIRQAVLRRGLKLVVADPRRIDITEFAALHLRQRPGTDVALVNGLMHLILKNNWHDERFIRDRCEGFDVFAASLAPYTPAYVAGLTGVSEAQLRQAAELLATNRPMAVLWSMGITQHTTGVMNVLALGNLQMLLGNIGVPGGGVNPLRGQNNVQGACDMGALPNVFPGYQAVTDPTALEKFAAAWQTNDDANASDTDASDTASPSPEYDAPLSSKPGLTVTEIIRAAGARQVRAMYIVGEDPAMTEPDSNHARAMLAAAELVVLQEIFPSETSVYADVVLPGAAFAEKDGTFTNTERRVQLVRKAIDPPGDAWPDWRITSALAQRLLQLEARRAAGPHAGWTYEHPAEIAAEIAALTPSYAGVSHQRLDRGDRLQWPVLDANHPGTPILHVGRFTRGKGKFHVVEHLDAAELPDEEFPLLLTTGRVLYHWHGGELTRRAAGLAAVYPQTLVEINAEDAIRTGVASGDVVRVRSRRGEMIAHAAVSDRVAAGVVFGNFHFPGNANVNNLTIAAVDPVAKIPEYKVCAVRLERATTE